MPQDGEGEWWAPRHSQFCFADKLGQALELCGEESEEKEQDGGGAGGKKQKKPTQMGDSGTVARLHNLQHLLAMIDQK